MHTTDNKPASRILDTVPGLARQLGCIALTLGCFAPPSAHAQDSGPCFERPGQTTPPCVLAEGRVIVETGIASWQRTTSRGQNDGEAAFASTFVRAGLVPQLELQAGWDGMIHSLSKVPGQAALSSTEPGDMTVGLMIGLSGTDGPVALQVFAKAPTGRGVGSSSHWSMGARLPVALAMSGSWQLGLTPELDLTVNEIGSGRHPVWGGSAGLSNPLSTRVGAGVDISIMRDEDPTGSSTQAIASASLAFLASPETQLDLGIGLALNRQSPDRQIYVGIARRF